MGFCMVKVCLRGKDVVADGLCGSGSGDLILFWNGMGWVLTNSGVGEGGNYSGVKGQSKRRWILHTDR